jgi:predicted permease
MRSSQAGFLESRGMALALPICGMEAFVRDLRYAIRMVVKSPGITAIALLTIGVATGANATVFGFVNALLLRPAPAVERPQTLVAIYTSDYSSGPYGESSYPDYLSLKGEAPAFSAMAAESANAAGVVRVGDRIERVGASSVTGEYFSMLGITPAHGRLITAADTEPGAPPVAVIGYRFWETILSGNLSALGMPLTTNGRTYTIVGVAARRFDGLDLGTLVQVWTPLVPPPAEPGSRGDRGLSIAARLRPGVSLTEAQIQVATIASRLATAYPDSNLGTLQAPTAPRPMYVLRHSRLPPDFKPMLQAIGAILMVAVGLVLVIACANVAGLLVSRAITRDREMAVRLALGAGRTRLVRQLLTESLLLGIGGGFCGLLLALWTSDLLPSFFPAEQAAMLDTSIDARTIAFIGVIAVASSLLFGLAPALQASGTISGLALRAATERTSESRGGTQVRRVLVASQVAAAVVLLVSSGLLVKSLLNALDADLGFGTRNGVVATVEVSEDRGPQYFAGTLEAVRGIPGIRDAAFVRTLPLSRAGRRLFRIDGYIPRPNEDMELVINVVSDAYFETMQIPVRAGRAFDGHDRAGTEPVVIVNDLLAARFYGGEALGKHLTDATNRTFRIIGIVQTHKYLTVQEPPVATVFYPLAQTFMPRMTLVARVDGPAAPMVDTVRRAMLGVNAGIPVYRAMTLQTHLDESTAGDRLTATLVAVCGGMALALATLGVYGVIAYAVARRTRELGIRIALGARPPDLVRLVLREGLTITAAGTALGLVAAAVAATALGSALPLYGVNPTDPLTYLTVPVVLVLVAILAALPPTQRALRLDPNVVLRQE